MHVDQSAFLIIEKHIDDLNLHDLVLMQFCVAVRIFHDESFTVLSIFYAQLLSRFAVFLVLLHSVEEAQIEVLLLSPCVFYYSTLAKNLAFERIVWLLLQVI